VVFGRNPKVTLLRAALWAAVCVVIFKILLVHVRVSGISMLPTCPDQSIYWVNRLAYVWRAPQRGDVVALRYIQTDNSISRLEPPHVMLLKRIIGLPGETVSFVNGSALINGEILDEPYETLDCNWNCAPVTLGPDEYYVVGDNRSMPPENHTHGIYERSRIVGKARL
jgi:signal peptidase I